MTDTAPQAPASNIRNYEIEKGTRLAITLKGGDRIAGTAIGRMQEGRGVDWYVTLRRMTGGTMRIEGADIATLTAF